jgi:hypothetical protein
MKFITNNLSHSTLHIVYKEKYIEETLNTKFLGLKTDNHLNWTNHIKQMIPKLSAARYAVRSIVQISNINTIKSIYCADFHIIIKHGIIFWGNCSNMRKIFTLRKKSVRTIADAQPRTLCRSLRKHLDSSPVPCQCTFSLMNFNVSNPENVQKNSSMQNITTRNKLHLHRLNANLPCFKKGTFYAGIKIFSILPQSDNP